MTLFMADYTSDLQATVFRGIDFLKWSSTTLERFDRIVGNPPYIPLTRVQSSIRRIAIQNLALDGNRSGTANTWAAFLSCSLNLLSEGGSMAFVLPSSWDYADYAEGIRKQIYRSFGSVEVYRSLRPLFSEVKEGSVVLVCREFGGPTRDVTRREYEDGDALVGVEAADEWLELN
jgi:methylase of polypeptide subunit release factors